MNLDLRARLARLHANHKRIASAAIVIGLLTLAAKLFVAAREMAIAWRYGTSDYVDAYQLAVTLTMWLPMMLTSVMTIVLVPRLVAIRHRADERRQFIAELNGTVLALATTIAVLTWLFSPVTSALIASSNSDQTVRITDHMSRSMAPVALFVILAGYLSARLQSRERYSYSFTEAIPAMFVAAVVLAPTPMADDTRLIAGTLAGCLVQTVVLCGMAIRHDAGLGLLRMRHRSRQWSSLYGTLMIVAAGQIILAATIPIDQAFAAPLGSGAVATLGYANRVTILISGLATVVIGRALLPVLSAAFAEGSEQLGERQARQWSLVLLLLGAVVAASVWLFAGWGVAIIFQRGAFTASDSGAVADVLRFGALQLPFYFAGLAMVQWVAASGRYDLLLKICCMAVILKLGLNFLLIQSLGLRGIMLATAGMYAFTFLCLSLSVRKWP